MAPMKCSDTPFSKILTLTNCWPKRWSHPSYPRQPTLRWCVDHQNRSSDCANWKSQSRMPREPIVWTRISLSISALTSTRPLKSSSAKIGNIVLICGSATSNEWSRTTMRKKRNRFQAAMKVAGARQVIGALISAWSASSQLWARCAVGAVPLTNEPKVDTTSTA